MLKVDPMERANINYVIKHPWFQIDLPRHLFPEPGQEQELEIINHEACNEVASKFNCSLETVKDSVRAHVTHCSSRDESSIGSHVTNSPADQYAVAYQLTIDNMNLQSKAPEFYSAQRKQSTSGLSNLSKPHPERMAQLLDSGPADTVGTHLSPSSNSSGSRTSDTRPKRPRSKWHLGIRSQSNHQHVMKEVYRALLDLGFEWKNISYFKIRVRLQNKNQPDKYDKMNITLYKSPRCSEKIPDYLLDFTSCPIDEEDASSTDWGSTHSTMNFFEMCSTIINKLANN
jgi:5'-AMP-activated protein kinase catalytic alpha subunit